MSTPIQELYLYLQGAGLLGSWTGPDASTQPAPVVQMRLLEEKEVKKKERLLLIKAVSSGGGDRFASSPVYTFAIMGVVGEDAVFPETYADLLYKSLLEFDSSDNIIGINPLGRIGGAYKTESGRPVYDMEFTVTSSGTIQALAFAVFIKYNKTVN